MRRRDDLGKDGELRSSGRKDTFALIVVLAAMALCVVACVSLDNGAGTYDDIDGVDGGVEWTYDSNIGKLTIRPAGSPESGYSSGQMKDYSETSEAPWKSSVNVGSTLVIESGITNIGDYAFCNCRFVHGLAMPDSVTTIGDYAFCNCETFMEAITIGQGVTTIGDFAYYRCTEAFSGTIIIPDSVTTIGVGAFAGCGGTKFSVAGGNTNFASSENGFLMDKNRTKIIACLMDSQESLAIPSTVTTISDFAFFECSELTGELAIGEKVTSIGVAAFAGCGGKISVVPK